MNSVFFIISHKNFGVQTEAEEIVTYFENLNQTQDCVDHWIRMGGVDAEAAHVIAKHHAALVIVAVRS